MYCSYSFAHPSIHSSSQLAIHLSIIHPFIYPPIHLASTHPSVHPSTHPVIHSIVHLPNRLSVKTVHSSVNPPIHPLILPSLHPPIPPSIHPSIHSFLYPSTHLSSLPPIHLSIHPSALIHPSTPLAEPLLTRTLTFYPSRPTCFSASCIYYLLLIRICVSKYKHLQRMCAQERRSDSPTAQLNRPGWFSNYACSCTGAESNEWGKGRQVFR